MKVNPFSRAHLAALIDRIKSFISSLRFPAGHVVLWSPCLYLKTKGPPNRAGPLSFLEPFAVSGYGQLAAVAVPLASSVTTPVLLGGVWI
jgi:hypothetical protein